MLDRRLLGTLARLHAPPRVARRVPQRPLPASSLLLTEAAPCRECAQQDDATPFDATLCDRAFDERLLRAAPSDATVVLLGGHSFIEPGLEAWRAQAISAGAHARPWLDRQLPWPALHVPSEPCRGPLLALWREGGIGTAAALQPSQHLGSRFYRGAAAAQLRTAP